MTLAVLITVGFALASLAVFACTRKIGKALAVQLVGGVIGFSLILAEFLRGMIGS